MMINNSRNIAGLVVLAALFIAPAIADAPHPSSPLQGQDVYIDENWSVADFTVPVKTTPEQAGKGPQKKMKEPNGTLRL